MVGTSAARLSASMRRLGGRARDVAVAPISPRATLWLAEKRLILGPRDGGPAVQLSSARSILVVTLDRCGDFVLLAPFIRELRRNAPHARIELIVRDDVADLARYCPYIDRLRELSV